MAIKADSLISLQRCQLFLHINTICSDYPSLSGGINIVLRQRKEVVEVCAVFSDCDCLCITQDHPVSHHSKVYCKRKAWNLRMYHPRLFSGIISETLLLYIKILSVSGVPVVVSKGKGEDAIVSHMRRGSTMVDSVMQRWAGDGAFHDWVDCLRVSGPHRT